MASTNRLKMVLLALFSIAVFAWAISATLSTALGVSVTGEPAAVAAIAGGNPDDYVGSETCQACHEDQFKKFKGTKHAKLKEIASWKDKAKGCESCHGPGKAHVEGSGDITKIISFKNKNPKETAETCLSCHSGKESHNNFRRGEHWRNDVGCTDCHSAHGTTLEDQKSGSQLFVGRSTRQNPGTAEENMLKASEPQLCLSCHTEQKQQFSKPFHHKVLEGTMKCTDCHNAHGGFENKQTKVAVGSDQACVKCHANKFGPYVFEHAPAKLEGCATCHTPHGSSNPKMLKRSSVRQMCLECHTGLLETAGELALPSLHNQAQIRYQNCTVCHNAIHGSNTNFYLTR
jgi:DmsE family decaheme c-type cytochrome